MFSKVERIGQWIPMNPVTQLFQYSASLQSCGCLRSSFFLLILPRLPGAWRRVFQSPLSDHHVSDLSELPYCHGSASLSPWVWHTPANIPAFSLTPHPSSCADPPISVWLWPCDSFVRALLAPPPTRRRPGLMPAAWPFGSFIHYLSLGLPSPSPLPSTLFLLFPSAKTLLCSMKIWLKNSTKAACYLWLNTSVMPEYSFSFLLIEVLWIVPGCSQIYLFHETLCFHLLFVPSLSLSLFSKKSLT